MCFGGSPSYNPPATPAVEPAPVIAPTPTEISSPTSTVISAEQKRQKIAAMKYGMQSTIKTSPQGVVGSINPVEPGKKTTLGV